MDYQYGQDYSMIEKIDTSPFKLQKGDVKYLKSKGTDVFDFVGFVLGESHILSVFPKHFYNETELSDLNKKCKPNNDDIKLLFDVFMKYINEVPTSAKADKHLGEKPDFISDYPFAPFFEVYRYYQKYGIYRESNTIIKANANGDISWKATIQKSELIISDDNLIFSPLFKKKKKHENVFLSECMVFVINHTINCFPYFISLPQIRYKFSSFDFLKHRQYTIEQLKRIYNKTFKDCTKKLVKDLISFFAQYKKSPKGGDIHIKISYFDKIWERMISKYLNKYFESVDESTNSLTFDKGMLSSRIEFTPKEFLVDNSHHKFRIRLDHYAKQDDAIYIFDSKYYYNIRDLNYKQFAYNELLRGTVANNIKIHSALILPSSSSDLKLHFSISPSFVGSRKTGTKIIEQYLDIKEVMQTYVSKE